MSCVAERALGNLRRQILPLIPRKKVDAVVQAQEGWGGGVGFLVG